MTLQELKQQLATTLDVGAEILQDAQRYQRLKALLEIKGRTVPATEPALWHLYGWLSVPAGITTLDAALDAALEQDAQAQRSPTAP